MEKIDIAEVKRLASLSALEFDEKSLEKFVGDFENILNMVGEIQKCDTSKVEIKRACHDFDELRDDEAKEGMSQEEVLLNSPKSRKGCFVVPQMLEE